MKEPFEPTFAKIECSLKTLKEMGRDHREVGYGNSDGDPFYTWYAHLLYLNRRKCLLFINALTRYPTFALQVTREDVRRLNFLLGSCLRLQLSREGVPEAPVGKLLDSLLAPQVSKSANRSVIGTAVEYERLIRALMDYREYGERTPTDIEMGLRLARTPILAMRPECFPFMAFSAELVRRYGETGRFDLKPIWLPDH